MTSATVPLSRSFRGRSGESSQGGFTLVGLLVAVAIVNIALAVTVTSWIAVDRRAAEAELIWRGRQYVRALECYQQQSGGALPTDLNELLETGCIRRLYGDPISRDAEWRVLRVGDLLSGVTEDSGLSSTADVSETGARTGGATGTTLSGALQASGSSGSRPGADGLGQRFQQLRGQRQQRFGARAGGSSDGIVGVVSRSERPGLRRYQQQERYSDWRFVVGDPG